MGIDVLGNLNSLRTKATPVLSTVAMELDVGHMKPGALEGLHRLQRGQVVIGNPQAVGVQVDRVG